MVWLVIRSCDISLANLGYKRSMKLFQSCIYCISNITKYESVFFTPLMREIRHICVYKKYNQIPASNMSNIPNVTSFL